MIINGDTHDFSNITLDELIKKFDLNQDHIVVEVDESIIDKSLFKNTFLSKDSKIEIIAFVGGG